MVSRHLRTTDIAKELGVHANTVRLYESRGFLPVIPREKNGYRQYSAMHLEQARLAYLTLRWPYLDDRSLLIDLVKSAARDDFGMAMELAYQYLARMRCVDHLPPGCASIMARFRWRVFPGLRSQTTIIRLAIAGSTSSILVGTGYDSDRGLIP
jgi:hypothetical protein